jgi:hypothetical protein
MLGTQGECHRNHKQRGSGETLHAHILRLIEDGCVQSHRPGAGDGHTFRDGLMSWPFMMRYLCFLLLAVLCAGRDLAGEADHGRPVVDIYVLRAGEQLQSPHVVTYRVAEWEQIRGRWILPDVGYYDTGYGKDQIWFTGAGGDVLHSRHVDWQQELYFSQEAGPASANKRSLWVWPVLDVRFRPRLTGQFVPYPTIPLDLAQRSSFDVDRAKVEWAASSHWQAGVGYAGGLCGSRTWQNHPFLTVTRTTRVGKVEAWLEQISGGAEVQLRYLLVRDER